MERPSLSGILFLLVCVDGLYRGAGDKYVVRMDELVSPLDRHILQLDKTSLFSPGLIRRRVRRPERRRGSRVQRSPDGGRNTFPEQVRSVQSYQGECGHQETLYDPPLHSTRIRNGTCAPYGSFPWVVQIQVLDGGKYRHRCGGSLISSTHVLTARHCFDGTTQARQLKVVVGQHDINGKDRNEMSFDVQDFWLHDDFQKDGPYSHDLALIKLRRNALGEGVTFSSSVSPICLPSVRTLLQPGHKCIVSGWGQIYPLSDLNTDCLRAAKVPLMEQRKCEDFYINSSQAIISKMLCAGYPLGGVDACKGDSGGPLACYIDGSYKLVGVISWGFGCGEAERPGVHTRVQAYLDWIKKKMRE